MSKKIALAAVGVGMILATASIAFAADTTPPSKPAGFSATPVSFSQINLSWTASTDDVAVTGYGVFRDGLQVGTTTATSFSDTGLAAGSTHSYAVDAFDAAGNLSTLSASVSTTTLSDTAAPSVPTGLVATAVSSSQINLSWSASTDNVGVTGYNIYRNGVKIASTGATSFSDTGLSASTGYSYTVAAYDAAGSASAQSSSSSATTFASSSTDTTAPSVPSGLSANAVSSSQINLSWNASTDNVGVTGYHVYRNGTLIGSTGATSFSDTGLSASTGYSYTVAAYDAAGNASAQSAGVSATTLASGSTTTVPNVSIPPTISIDQNGAITLRGLTVTSVGTNTFTGTVWGITYTVNYSGTVTGNGRNRFQFYLRNGDSATVSANQIQVGDVLGVQGTVTQSAPSTITAKTVRDYSITTLRASDNDDNGTNFYGNYSIQSLQQLLQQLLSRYNELRRR